VARLFGMLCSHMIFADPVNVSLYDLPATTTAKASSLKTSFATPRKSLAVTASMLLALESPAPLKHNAEYEALLHGACMRFGRYPTA
jgi:hypothetical protein